MFVHVFDIVTTNYPLTNPLKVNGMVDRYFGVTHRNTCTNMDDPKKCNMKIFFFIFFRRAIFRPRKGG